MKHGSLVVKAVLQQPLKLNTPLYFTYVILALKFTVTFRSQAAYPALSPFAPQLTFNHLVNICNITLIVYIPTPPTDDFVSFYDCSYT